MHGGRQAMCLLGVYVFFFQAEDGIRDKLVTGVQTCALPILSPQRSQDPQNLAGKILRFTPEGAIPKDNPIPDSAAYILGIRNTQGFDWRTDGTRSEERRVGKEARLLRSPQRSAHEHRRLRIT